MTMQWRQYDAQVLPFGKPRISRELRREQAIPIPDVQEHQSVITEMLAEGYTARQIRAVRISQGDVFRPDPDCAAQADAPSWHEASSAPTAPVI